MGTDRRRSAKVSRKRPKQPDLAPRRHAAREPDRRGRVRLVALDVAVKAAAYALFEVVKRIPDIF